MKFRSQTVLQRVLQSIRVGKDSLGCGIFLINNQTTPGPSMIALICDRYGPRFFATIIFVVSLPCTSGNSIQRSITVSLIIELKDNEVKPVNAKPEEKGATTCTNGSKVVHAAWLQYQIQDNKVRAYLHPESVILPPLILSKVVRKIELTAHPVVRAEQV